MIKIKDKPWKGSGGRMQLNQQVHILAIYHYRANHCKMSQTGHHQIEILRKVRKLRQWYLALYSSNSEWLETYFKFFWMGTWRAQYTKSIRQKCNVATSGKKHGLFETIWCPLGSSLRLSSTVLIINNNFRLCWSEKSTLYLKIQYFRLK